MKRVHGKLSDDKPFTIKGTRAFTLGVFTVVFMDDILVFCKNDEEHKEHLEKVYDVLRKHKLCAKRNKCQFFHCLSIFEEVFMVGDFDAQSSSHQG